jgi:hypothetical protein
MEGPFFTEIGAPNETSIASGRLCYIAVKSFWLARAGLGMGDGILRLFPFQNI